MKEIKDGTNKSEDIPCPRKFFKLYHKSHYPIPDHMQYLENNKSQNKNSSI